MQISEEELYETSRMESRRASSYAVVFVFEPTVDQDFASQLLMLLYYCCTTVLLTVIFARIIIHPFLLNVRFVTPSRDTYP